MSVHYSKGFNNLRISPYEVEHLLDLKIEQKINEHGTLYFKGLLPNDKKDSYVGFISDKINVSLSVVEESGNEYILFQGMVQDVEVGAMQEMYYIEVYAVSYSSMLDIEKKSRSFQNKKMTYEQLFQQVTAAYPGAGVMDMASNNKPTNKFIMQHMETDWEFLKRLASHFNTGLVCDTRFDKPRNYVGIPQIQSIELDCFNYSVKKDLKKFKQLSENGVKGLHENDFIYYEVETDKEVHIGDEVSLQNKKLYIAQIISVVEKGIFVSRCTLAPKKGLSQMYQNHDKIAGGSFNGKIIEIKNDRVKVDLDVDRGHDSGDPCFFPYSTIYSSQDGSGWYCMPENGDSVRIYFPDGDEDHAYAISSVHNQVDPSLQQQSSSGGASGGSSGGAGGYSGQRDDPNVKSLRNASGKEIRLTPEGIFIIVEGATITLTDENGIEIKSENDISFKSDQNIIMSAVEEVLIIGKTEVCLRSESATISMADNVEIVGQEVKAN